MTASRKEERPRRTQEPMKSLEGAQTLKAPETAWDVSRRSIVEAVGRFQKVLKALETTWVFFRVAFGEASGA